jgi:tetratricopeptide (TPR) repeat protein
MNLIRRWFWPRSIRSEALSLYRLGMARTEKEDTKGAMNAYTSAIEQPDAPDDVKAMALYNRALLYAAGGNTNKALADLQAIMEMPIPLYGVKLAAKRRLERLQHRQDAAVRPNRRSTS